MNVAAHDRREQRRLTRLLADAVIHLQVSSPVRCSAPQSQGINAADLRKKVHQLGPTASLVRVGHLHWICTVGRTQRFEGYLGEVYDQLKPLFKRLNIQ